MKLAIKDLIKQSRLKLCREQHRFPEHKTSQVFHTLLPILTVIQRSNHQLVHYFQVRKCTTRQTKNSFTEQKGQRLIVLLLKILHFIIENQLQSIPITINFIDFILFKPYIIWGVYISPHTITAQLKIMALVRS